MSGIISRLSSFGWSICQTFSSIFDFLTTYTLSDVLNNQIINTWFSTFIEWLVTNLGWGDVTIFEVMLGGGLTLVIALTFIKWVIGIVV